MERREFVALAGATATAGCNACLPLVGNGARTEFRRSRAGYAMTVENSTEAVVEARIRVEDSAGGVSDSEERLEPGGATTVLEPFTSGNHPYEVTISANGETETRTLSPEVPPADKLTFTVTAASIDVQRGRRDEPDLAVSNRREVALDVTVTVDPPDGERVHDVLSMPADGFRSYREAVPDGSESEVTAEADGKCKSTEFHNSATSTLWITVEENSLSLDVGEE